MNEIQEPGTRLPALGPRGEGWVVLQGSLLGAVFYLKARHEEAWLPDHCGGYAAYMDRTRRLIPWVY